MMEGKHDFGCVMLFFELSGMGSFHDVLEIGDIYTKDGHGLETQPHVTLLYGFDDNVNPNEVIDVVKKYDYTHVKLHNVSVFENEEYDVLKLDAELEILQNVHSELRKFPHSDVYSVYHPHMTIAYLKPGTGHKYIDKLKWVKLLMCPTQIVYSKSNGELTKQKI